MTVYLNLDQVHDLHRWALQVADGTEGIRNITLVESAVENPRHTFGGSELYPTIIDKAAILGFSLSQNQGYTDGNKRVGFYAMAQFLGMNGATLSCSEAEGEAVFTSVADKNMSKEEFTEWVRSVTTTTSDNSPALPSA